MLVLIISDTFDCKGFLKSRNPASILCVKNCSYSDPVHGNGEILFGEKMVFNPLPGYKWKNSLGNDILETRCDFFDFGGIYESIKLDYTWKCQEGFFQKEDSSCEGITNT